MPLVVEKTKDGKKVVDESKSFRGYPFYIAAKAGHRPPQAPRDLDGNEDKETLRRHIIVGGTSTDGIGASEPADIIKDVTRHSKLPDRSGEKDLREVGKKLSDYTARRVYRDNQNNDFFVVARQLEKASIEGRAEAGELSEKSAMQFHAGVFDLGKHGKAQGSKEPGWSHTPYNWEAPGYSSCLPDGSCDNREGSRVLFRVNGGGNIGPYTSTQKGNPGDGIAGAPFSNPCPKQYVAEDGSVRPVKTRAYRAVYIQMDMTVNKAGWHDPQARFPVLEEDVKATLNGSRPTEPLFFRANSGECIEFYATNLIPSNLNLDDFQVYSPTDTIGQHIHLVKFDVTSSDGSGNGWNYEDGTLAADEVRERIVANNALVKFCEEKPHDKACPETPPSKLQPKTHPIFLRKGELGAKEDGALAGDYRGYCADVGKQAAIYEKWLKDKKGEISKEEVEKTNKIINEMRKGNDDDIRGHPWCGAQTTIQRWWADPVLNGKPGDKDVKDRTLRTVFTHDHFGPSSHQHHGFYAALVVEPSNSKWTFLDGRDMGGTDEKGNAIHVRDPLTNKLRHDGGPTSYAANIIAREGGKACLNNETTECSKQLDTKGSVERRRTGREFNLAFADFAIVYTSDLKKNEPLDGNRHRPVNPPNHIEGGVLNPATPGLIPSPEGISTKDPGTQLINYRNEPIPLRIGEWKRLSRRQKYQALGLVYRSGTGNPVLCKRMRRDKSTLK
jgi:hypothetical protein